MMENSLRSLADTRLYRIRLTDQLQTCRDVACNVPALLITNQSGIKFDSRECADYFNVNMLSSIGVLTSTLVKVRTKSIPLAEEVVFMGTISPLKSL
jgi:hypothetical protein